MSRPRLAWFCMAAIVCAAILAVALLILNRRAMTIAEQAREVTRLGAENRQLRSQSDELAREIEELRRQTGMPPPVAEIPVRRAARAEVPVSTLEAIRTLGQLHESLAGAKSTIEQLRDRMMQLESEIESVTEENRLLTARGVELNEKLSGESRLVEALRAELKGKDKRLAPLQTANRSLRKRSRATEQKISRIRKWIVQLEEINRRREAYLTNILRRYWDVTEQYGALAAQLDRPAETAATTRTEVSRIQNAISMTEEDLRQLKNLNAQAERLQRKIRKD